MASIKGFFNKQTIINCLLFAAIISVPFVWKHTHDRHLPLFSSHSGQIYLSFVAISFVVFLMVFLGLFLMGKKGE
jgi:hypothetical protein